jgi:hypothetical protein
MTFTTKQQYLPSSNILQTRYICEEGVVDLLDFFPRPRHSSVVAKLPKAMPFRESVSVQDELKRWLVRRVECIRGSMDLGRHDHIIPLFAKCNILIDGPQTSTFFQLSIMHEANILQRYYYQTTHLDVSIAKLWSSQVRNVAFNLMLPLTTARKTQIRVLR